MLSVKRRGFQILTRPLILITIIINGEKAQSAETIFTRLQLPVAISALLRFKINFETTVP
jgi:hypothetical protein